MRQVGGHIDHVREGDSMLQFGTLHEREIEYEALELYGEDGRQCVEVQSLLCVDLCLTVVAAPSIVAGECFGLDKLSHGLL